MKSVYLAAMVLLLSISALAQPDPIEDGWKGIKLFETRRQQVEKLFGPPKSTTSKLYTVYPTSEGTVAIEYSAEPCTDAPAKRGEFNIEKDTVISFVVTPAKPFPLSELNSAKDLSDRPRDQHRLGYFLIGNRKNRIGISTRLEEDGTERAVQIVFAPTVEQIRQHQCTK